MIHGRAHAFAHNGTLVKPPFESLRCSPHLKWTGQPTSQQRGFASERRKPSQDTPATEWRLQTLAIETSCDDTSVAVFSISWERDNSLFRSKVLFHEKVTADSHGYSGIHPLVALHSHRRELGHLVQRAIKTLEPGRLSSADDIDVNSDTSQSDLTSSLQDARPDFVTVTRGPGMRSNLDVGLNTAKGLALAWHIPILGVHHMQAHALTPRLCTTIGAGDGFAHRDQSKDCGPPGRLWDPHEVEPRFPFLGLLVSGGHTMLIESKSLTNHHILAETQDIAIGDYLDKVARVILTDSELRTPYGKALEDFAFGPGNDIVSRYEAPRRRKEELEPRETGYSWTINPPLAQTRRGDKSSRRMLFSFSGLLSSILRIENDLLAGTSGDDVARLSIPKMPLAERQELAREVQRVAFEHLGSRILLHLEDSGIKKDDTAAGPPYTVVVSGGVASNKFLRHVLRSMLDARGYTNIRLLFPPPELCTDNALMIAWAGMEMYLAGYESELSIGPLRKWSMDSRAEDGGILGVGGWKRLSQTI